jgi:hypothetical protein
MFATSASSQNSPTLVLFGHIALQAIQVLQIMLRVWFNRGNLTCVFRFGRFGTFARPLTYSSFG